MTKIHIVFDFDCTLTSRHLYHTMHSGDIYLTHLRKQQRNHWDTKSTRVMGRIAKFESLYEEGKDGEYGHLPGILCNAHAFTSYIFGGETRITQLKQLIKRLSLMDVVLHISTKGIISDVIDMLRNIQILQYFHFIEGFDNTYECKIVYRVGKGFMQNRLTFYGRAADLTGLPNTFHFESKPDFIRHIAEVDTNVVFYLDDDKEFYDDVVQYSNVRTVDIGDKEGIYATGKHNLGDAQMLSLLKLVCREKCKYTK